jgi:hypothetical protein
MRTFAEFHDSRVRSIIQRGDEVIVEFPHVYLHVFEGEPFQSPGNGCGQTGRLVFSGVQSVSIPDLPIEDDDHSFDVWEGSIWADGRHLNNVFEIPLNFTASEIQAEILLNLGQIFKVSCTGISYIEINEPHFIERLRA